MARTPTRPRTASLKGQNRSPKRPGPTPSWLNRNRWWLAVVVVMLLVAVVLIARGDDKPASPSGGEAMVGGDLHSLVVDPANPERLFVGGHQAVSASSDGGRSWQPVPSLEGADAMGWAFAPDAIYVSGHPGLSRSADGGQSFRRQNQGLPDTDLHALGAGAGVLYGASPAGIFASNDGGGSWQVRSEAAGPALFGRILVDPKNPEHLVAADVRSGPVDSSDGGRTWRKLGGLRAATWVSQAGPDTQALVASGPTGASRSADGGRNWSPVNLPEGGLLVEASASNPELLYAADHQGNVAQVWVSRDGGRTWARP